MGNRWNFRRGCSKPPQHDQDFRNRKLMVLRDYGPGINAWPITSTPAYQYRIFFARAGISYVGTSSTTPGPVFGRNGPETTQTRGLLEAGILF